jgi:hypothetical protein
MSWKPKVGEQVRVRINPPYPYKKPFFLKEMHEFCGKVITVKDHSPNGYVIAEGWNWHVDWLMPIWHVLKPDDKEPPLRSW